MIDRRTFNKMAGLAGLSALAGRVDLGAEQNPPPDQSAAPSIGQPAPTGDVILEDDQLLVGFDANSGVLTRFERKSTNWILERRPELGVSFRLHAPMPDRRDNFVLGKMQRA